MSEPPSFTWFDDVAGSVEIPDEGTLSKVLFKDDRLRVVLFAFDEDQTLSEHTATVPAVVQVLSGAASASASAPTVWRPVRDRGCTCRRTCPTRSPRSSPA